MRLSPLVVLILFIPLFLWTIASPAAAQDPATSPADHVHEHDATRGAAPTESPAWSWSPDANVFFGYNYQQREFTDQSAWESQNWFMLHGARPLGRGRASASRA